MTQAHRSVRQNRIDGVNASPILDHVIDTRYAGNIGDFMYIRHYSYGTVTHRRMAAQANVDMGVYQTGQEAAVISDRFILLDCLL